MIPVDAYRIGWTWLRRLPGEWWPHNLTAGKVRWRKPRSWATLIPLRRPWQAEVTLPDCSCNARRAFTREGAVKAVWRAHLQAVKSRGCWSALSETERAAAV